MGYGGYGGMGGYGGFPQQQMGYGGFPQQMGYGGYGGYGGFPQQMGGYPPQMGYGGMGGFPQQMGGYNPMFGGIGGLGYNPMMGPGFGQPMGQFGGYGGGYGGPIDEGTGGGYPNQGPLSKFQQLMNPPVGKQITSLVPEEGMMPSVPGYGKGENQSQANVMRLLEQMSRNMQGTPSRAAMEPFVSY
jgi:hypothetical protein